MLLYPPLSISTIVRRYPSWIDVAISDAIIRKEPSPTRTYTSRSGAAILIPSPPAISYPIVEKPYSRWNCFGWRARHSL